MNDFDDRDGWLDEDLRMLAVHDVSTERARRTSDACLAVLARRRAPPARRGWVARAEVLAATVVGLVYLAAAIRASLALLQL
jgi:hypothetical protein